MLERFLDSAEIFSLPVLVLTSTFVVIMCIFMYEIAKLLRKKINWGIKQQYKDHLFPELVNMSPDFKDLSLEEAVHLTIFSCRGKRWWNRISLCYTHIYFERVYKFSKVHMRGNCPIKKALGFYPAIEKEQK